MEIWTDNEMGSSAQLVVWFYSAENKDSGTFAIYFSSQVFDLRHCKQSSNSLTDVPSTTIKIWKIALTKADWTVRVVVHCNDVEVVNYLMSDSNCKGTDWRLNGRWKNKVTKIKFRTGDTASDYYKPFQGNYINFNGDNTDQGTPQHILNFYSMGVVVHDDDSCGGEFWHTEYL